MGIDDKVIEEIIKQMRFQHVIKYNPHLPPRSAGLSCLGDR